MPNLTYQAHADLIDTWPTPLTVGLLSAAPNPDGTSVLEPETADGYEQQEFAFDTAQADGITTLVNNQNIVFGPATNDWIAVNYFGLFDADGALRLYGRLRTARAVTTGNAATFVAGKIQIRLR